MEVSIYYTIFLYNNVASSRLASRPKLLNMNNAMLIIKMSLSLFYIVYQIFLFCANIAC